MAKKRIYELARDMGKKPSEIISVLSANKITKSNFSYADDNDILILQKHFRTGAPAQPKSVNTTAKPQGAPSGSAQVKGGSPAGKPQAAQGAPTQNKNAGGSATGKPQAAPAKPVVQPQQAAQRPAGSGNANNQNNKPQQGGKSQGPRPVQPVKPASAKPQPATGNRPLSLNERLAQMTKTRSLSPQRAQQQYQQQQRQQSSGYGNRPQGGQGGQQRGGVFVGGPRGQRPGQGRPQGGSFQGRPGQGGSFQGRPGQGGSFQGRPGQGGSFQGRPGQGGSFQGRPQGGSFQGRPGQGGGFQNRPQGGFGGRPGMNKDGDDDRQQNNYKNKNHPGARKPASGGFGADLPRGKESREQYNKRKQKPVKGQYASKDSRPNRSADHMRPMGAKHGKDNKPNMQPREVIRPTSVKIGDSINVKEFATMLKREVSEVIKCLFLLGTMVTINQDIDFDTATIVGDNFGVEVLPLPPEEDPTEVPEIEDDPALRVLRPPVVTVMGHVDHGKTSLLDAIRKTNVTAREAGGITQHIGAYMVNLKGKKIVFLDTPGHEAFTAMRARGAQCTDIAVLVVAADDGVMPQTIEAINHAKAAKVPIIVAINKMDKPGANPDHVKQQLAERELIPEDWGGDVIMVPVSARQKTGIEDLLEMILLVAEVQELKANPDLPARGTIVEAQLDKGRGPVATVLIQRGTLHVGDTIVAGTAYGKVRAMMNDRGEKVRKAGPSTPVEVLGLNAVPMAGDIMDSTDERTARSVAEKRIAKAKAEEVKAAKVSLDDLFSRIKEGELKELNLVVKADVQGTIEALRGSLEKIKNDEVKVSVIHSGVGAINESDVMLASSANALIIGFNVRPDANARKLQEKEKVDIRTYRVIYDALNDVEAAIKGMLAPKFEEQIIGRVEVRQIITISKLIIAGCYVTEGKVTNSAKIRVVRDGIVIAEDEMESLRRFKDDVKEVASGYECGITLAKFHDLKEGDVFEAYVMEEVTPE